MPMLAASIPPISKEAFDRIDQTFRLVTPVPNITTMDELMHNAGSREVVEWIRVHLLRESTIVRGDVSQTVAIR
jgi:hypothetical protein